MANRTVRRETGSDVIWNRAAERRSAIPFRRVATVTGRGHKSEIVAHVAGSAGCRG
jgi:hypothetical protein